MDWLEDMKSNLWLFPRGIKREGLAGKNSLTWTSKGGRTVPSLRLSVEIKRTKWKQFKSYLDRWTERYFDEIYNYFKLHNATCSNAIRLLVIHLVLMPIIFELHTPKTVCWLQRHADKDRLMLWRRASRPKLLRWMHFDGEYFK